MRFTNKYRYALFLSVALCIAGCVAGSQFFDWNVKHSNDSVTYMLAENDVVYVFSEDKYENRQANISRYQGESLIWTSEVPLDEIAALRKSQLVNYNGEQYVAVVGSKKGATGETRVFIYDDTGDLAQLSNLDGNYNGSNVRNGKLGVLVKRGNVKTLYELDSNYTWQEVIQLEEPSHFIGLHSVKDQWLVVNYSSNNVLLVAPLGEVLWQVNLESGSFFSRILLSEQNLLLTTYNNLEPFYYTINVLYGELTPALLPTDFQPNAIDSSGHVVGWSGFDNNFYLSKYDLLGNEQWRSDIAYQSSNSYASTPTIATSPTSDIFVLKNTEIEDGSHILGQVYKHTSSIDQYSNSGDFITQYSATPYRYAINGCAPDICFKYSVNAGYDISRLQVTSQGNLYAEGDYTKAGPFFILQMEPVFGRVDLTIR